MSSRYDQIVKFINEALKNDHLYSNEELAFMKSQLRQLRETKNRYGRRIVVDLVLKKDGSECLSKPSFAVPKITDNIRDLAAAMKVKMVEWNGIGLAAPQVGHNVRLIVIRLSTGQIQGDDQSPYQLDIS